MKDQVKEESVTHDHQLKIDPGAKTTGIAILQEDKVVWAAELTHRGFQIRDDLTTRRQVRRSRRNKATRAEVEKRVTTEAAIARRNSFDVLNFYLKKTQ